MRDHDLPDRRSLLLAGASLLTLSACGNLIGPGDTSSQLYVLSPQLPSAAGGAPLKVQLAVATPQASGSLMTDRIALIRNGIFDYYASAQWTDATPQLLQNLLVEALEKDGAMGSVARDSEGIHANYIVQSDIRAFEARYDHGDAAPTVVVTVTVKVVSAAHSEIVDAKEFHQESVATANNIPAVVTAFDGALVAILPEIAQRVLDIARRPMRP